MPPTDPGSGREETEGERIDRNLGELLGELRVALPGVQVLFAFLLIVPFNQGFGDLSSFQEHLYLATLLFAALATALLMAPTAQHRLTFRLQDKHHLVSTANRYAIAGISCLAIAMTLAIALVTDDVVFSRAAAVASTVGIAAVFTLVWGVAPVLRRRAIEAEREDGNDG